MYYATVHSIFFRFSINFIITQKKAILNTLFAFKQKTSFLLRFLFETLIKDFIFKLEIIILWNKLSYFQNANRILKTNMKIRTN